MLADIKITGVSITPNPVNTNEIFVLSIQIDPAEFGIVTTDNKYILNTDDKFILTNNN